LQSSGRGKRLKIIEKEEEKSKEVVHVRARRGQATDSHSLAERVNLIKNFYLIFQVYLESNHGVDRSLMNVLFSIRLEEERLTKDSDACRTLSQDAIR
jgi:hypothetical protein